MKDCKVVLYRDELMINKPKRSKHNEATKSHQNSIIKRDDTEQNETKQSEKIETMRRYPKRTGAIAKSQPEQSNERDEIKPNQSKKIETLRRYSKRTKDRKPSEQLNQSKEIEAKSSHSKRTNKKEEKKKCKQPKTQDLQEKEARSERQIAIIHWVPAKGDIVWGKMRGYALWPAKVLNVEGNGVDILFYGDRTTARLNKTCIFSFQYGAARYVPKERKNPLLEKSVKEALFEYQIARKKL